LTYFSSLISPSYPAPSFVHSGNHSIMAAEPVASNPSLAASGYMVSSVDKYSYGSDDEVASLPSESTSSSDLDALSDDYSDAEEEWRESIEQLELLLSMVLVPFVGKYLGRKCAYWSMCSVSRVVIIARMLTGSSLHRLD